MKGGTIYQEGKKWVWKSPPYLENGVKKRTRKSFDTEDEAIAQRDKFLFQIYGNDNKYVVGLTVKEAYEKWAKEAWSDEQYITYNTQRGYIDAFVTHILPFIGHLPIDNLNVVPFNKHLNDMAEQGKAQKTINNVKYALAKLLSYCSDNGWIDVNNIYKVRLPKAKKRQRARIVNTITEAEYQAIVKTMRYQCSQYEPIIRFLRETGIRAEELAIKESDIHGNAFQVVRAIKRKDITTDRHKSVLIASDILKTTAAYRTVPLSENARKAISDTLEWKRGNGIKSDFIFCTRTGSLIEQRNILRAFHVAISKTTLNGKPLEKRGLHSLRKLFCKTLKDLPTEWEQVRAIMGHETIAISQRYYYSMDTDDIDNIAELLSNR